MLITEAFKSGEIYMGVGRWDLGPEARCVKDMKPFSRMCLYSIEG